MKTAGISAAGAPPAAVTAGAGRSGRVARNVLATLGTQLVSWGLTFAVTLYLPRYVGDVGLGRLSFAASFVALFGVLVPLGTSTVLVKEIARDRARAATLLPAALLLRLPLGLIASGLAIGAVGVLGYSPLIRVLVTVAALGMTVFALNDALASALQGLENLPRQSVAVLTEKFLASGLTIALVFARAPLWMLATVGLGTGVVSLLVNLSAFPALWRQWRLPSPATLRGLALAGLPFLGYGLFTTLYGQTDPIVLKFVTNDATVGWYTAAFRLIGTTLFLPTAVMSALLPTLARLHREDEADFRRLARRTFSLIMLCGIPVSLLLLLAPDRLVALMHYPAAFVHSVPVLRVGGLAALLWYAASVLANLVTARDDQTKMFRVSIAASLLGIPLCVIGSVLGDRLWHNGAVGAIASDVLLEVYLVACYWRMLPPGTFDRGTLWIIGRAGLAALPMAWCLHALGRGRNAVLGIGLAVGVYALSCWLLRCLGRRDLALLSEVFARKTGAVRPSRPLRTLMVTPYYPPGVGGAPRLLQGITDHLRGRGHHVEVLSYGAPMNNDCETFDRAQPYPIYRIPAHAQTGRTTLQMGGRLLRLALTRRPDVLFCGVAYPSAILAHGVSLLFQIPFVVYSHGEDASPIKDTRRKRHFLERALAAAGVVLVNSRFTRGEIEAFGIPDAQIAIIPPGIDPNPYQRVAPEQVVALRRRLNLDGRRVVLTVARLTERKGHDMVVRSLAQVRRSAPDVHYLIVGKGDTEALESLARAEGVGDAVTILPYVAEEDLFALYHLCDVYAMVSRRDPVTSEVEGFGIVYLEAGACGKPCLAGSEGGSGDAVLDGVTGFVVPPTDVPAIAGALETLLSDPALAARMGGAARSRVCAEFRSDQLLEQIERHVSQTAGRAK